MAFSKCIRNYLIWSQDQISIEFIQKKISVLILPLRKKKTNKNEQTKKRITIVFSDVTGTYYKQPLTCGPVSSIHLHGLIGKMTGIDKMGTPLTRDFFVNGNKTLLKICAL